MHATTKYVKLPNQCCPLTERGITSTPEIQAGLPTYSVWINTFRTTQLDTSVFLPQSIQKDSKFSTIKKKREFRNDYTSACPVNWQNSSFLVSFYPFHILLYYFSSRLFHYSIKFTPLFFFPFLHSKTPRQLLDIRSLKTTAMVIYVFFTFMVPGILVILVT